MRRAPLAFAAVAAALLACTAPARAAGPALLLGVNEDVVKQPTMAQTKAKMGILRLAGFDSVRISVLWWPGLTEPEAKEVQKLRNVVGAAQLANVRVFVTVLNWGNRYTPLSEEDARGSGGEQQRCRGDPAVPAHGSRG